MAATLGQLAGVRSSVARGLMAYLRALVKWVDQESPPHLKGRRLVDLYVTPEVLKQEENRELPGRRMRADSLAEEQTGRFAPEEDRRRRIRWDREVRRVGRAAIVGLPGSGKTLLGRMTARDLARHSLEDLEAQRKGIDEVAIPVWVRLADVADRGLNAAVDEHIRFLLEGADVTEQGRRASRWAVQHITQALSRPQVWLFLDALDEVPEPGRLKDKLRSLTHARCRIVVTSRPYGYDVGYLPFSLEAEYELAPFRPSQRWQFMNNWFPNDEQRRSRLQELAQASPQFDDLTRNALLLTLTCATVENQKLSPEQTRRVDLYRSVVPDMLRRVWREDAHRADSEGPEEIYLLLQHVAWSLFRDDPRRTLFSYKELRRALQNACHTLEMKSKPEALLSDLRRTGLIIAPVSSRRMFVHRSFLDFLAAEHAADQLDPVSLIKPFLWQRNKDGVLHWQPAAAEMICMLAGCMPSAGPLFSYLLIEDIERPDYFGTMTQLAGRALADANSPDDSGQVAQEIVSRLMDLRDRLGKDLREGLIASLKSPIATAALIGRFRDRYSDAVCNALRSIGTRAALEALIERIRVGEDHDLTARERELLRRCVKALAKARSPLALPFIISRIREDADSASRRLCARALGELGNGEAIPDLMRILDKDPDPQVRAAAAEALSMIEIESGQVIDALTRRSQQDPDENVRKAAATVLGRIGAERVDPAPPEIARREGNSDPLHQPAKGAIAYYEQLPVSTLIRMATEEPDRSARERAIKAMGNLRDKNGIPTLTKAMLDDPDLTIKCEAANALGRIGDEAAILALAGVLRGGSCPSPPAPRTGVPDHAVLRCRAAYALGLICAEESGTDLACAMHQDPEPQVRAEAEKALARIYYRYHRWFPLVAPGFFR